MILLLLHSLRRRLNTVHTGKCLGRQEGGHGSVILLLLRSLHRRLNTVHAGKCLGRQEGGHG